MLKIVNITGFIKNDSYFNFTHQESLTHMDALKILTDMI